MMGLIDLIKGPGLIENQGELSASSLRADLRLGLDARSFRRALRALESHEAVQFLVKNIEPQSCLPLSNFGRNNPGPSLAIGAKGFGRVEMQLYRDGLGYPEITPKFYHDLPTTVVKQFLSKGITLEDVIVKINKAAETLRAGEMGSPLLPWEI